MNKKELQEKKIIVKEMGEAYANLSPNDRQEYLRLKCQTDFLTFAIFITDGIFKPFDVHKLICNFVQKVGDGDPSIRRSIISLPPRTGKSLLISRVFPAWQIGRNPRAQFIMSSYSLGLSTENSRAVIDFMSSEKFSWAFPECTLNKKGCNLTAIRTKEGGLIKTASASGNVTGFGFGDIDDSELPGLGILDDLLADGNSPTVMESTFNWVQTQFLTRALPNNAIISMGTRFHRDDIAGRLISSNPDDWKLLNVPAICTDKETDPMGREIGQSHWPEFFPTQALAVIRRSIGERDFSALYQGSPITASGAIFKDFWFTSHENNEELEFSYRFITIDTAYKEKTTNDYSAICIWGFNKVKQRLYLIDYVMDRYDFPDLQRVVIDVVDKHKIRAVYIEGRASGAPLIQTLKKFLRVSIRELVPNQDKVLRANSVAPLVENGIVSIYSGIEAYDERLDDLCSFPYIRNDDFVDAFVYGLMVARDDLGIRVESFLEANPDIASRPITLFDEHAECDRFKIVGLKNKEIETKSPSKIRTTKLQHTRAGSGSGGKIIFR